MEGTSTRLKSRWASHDEMLVEKVMATVNDDTLREHGQHWIKLAKTSLVDQTTPALDVLRSPAGRVWPLWHGFRGTAECHAVIQPHRIYSGCS